MNYFIIARSQADAAYVTSADPRLKLERVDEYLFSYAGPLVCSGCYLD
jgi:hypothetical protein